MRYTEEDWERLSELEKMYLIEKQKEIESEYEEWENEQGNKRLPAIVKIKKQKIKNGSKGWNL